MKAAVKSSFGPIAQTICCHLSVYLSSEDEYRHTHTHTTLVFLVHVPVYETRIPLLLQKMMALLGFLIFCHRSGIAAVAFALEEIRSQGSSKLMCL